MRIDGTPDCSDAVRPIQGNPAAVGIGVLAGLALLGLCGIAEAQSRSQRAIGDEHRARTLIDQGLPEAAVPIYKALQQESPGDLKILLGLTVAHFKARHYRDAIRVCHDMLRSQPHSVPAHLFLGASHFQLGEFEDAVEPLGRVITLAPDERNARLMLAEALLLSDRHAEALPHFQVASDLLPNDPRPWYGLHRIYDHLGRQAENQLAQGFPESGYALAVLGRRREAAGNYGIAARRFLGALADQTLDHFARQATVSDLMEIYERSGHGDWALAAARRFRSERVPDCTLRAESHACLYRAGQFEEILNADPSASFPSHSFWKARALAQLAVQARERLAGLGESPQLHEIDARAHGERGNHRVAAGLWKRALALDRGNRVLKLGLANALYESNDYSKAIPLLDELIADEPGSARLLFLRGACLLNVQQAERAVRDLSRAVDLKSDFGAARAELARAHLMTGVPDLAISQLLEILESDRDGTPHYRIAQAYQQVGKYDLAKEALATYHKLMLADRTRQQALLREYSEVPPPTQAENKSRR